MFYKQMKAMSYFNEALKRVGVCMMIILCTMFLTVTTWAQSLENGTYTISNNVSHDNPVGEGMARSYTEALSDIEVNDNGIYVSLKFNNTQFMGDFTIAVNGSNVNYEVVTLANNMKQLKFKVPNLSASIQVGLYVTAMDTNVVYTVHLDENSLKLVKKAEIAPVADKSNKTESIEASKPEAPQKVETKVETKVEAPSVPKETVSKEIAQKEAIQKEQVQTEIKAEQVTEKEQIKAEEAVKTAEAEIKIEAQERTEIQKEAEDKVQEKIEEAENLEEVTQVEELEAREDLTEDIQSTEEDAKAVKVPFLIGGSILVLIIGGAIYLKRK